MRTHFPLRRAFTLVEVLVSASVLGLMMIIIAEMMTSTQDTISTATAKTTKFQEARRALDAITHSLSQANMDAVWAYRRNSSDPTSITGYERTSDHHFVLGPAAELIPNQSEAGQAVFFQAPLGSADQKAHQQLHQLINCVGFYIRYDGELQSRPEFLRSGYSEQLYPERQRFRLVQYLQPAEASSLYSASLGLNKLTSQSQALKWFQTDLAKFSRPIADNVLAIVLTPHVANVDKQSGETSILPDPSYRYDSRDAQWNGLNDSTRMRRHQLPPLVQIVLIMTEEKSYEALEGRYGAPQAAAAIRHALSNKFSEADKLEEDLAAVEKALNDLKLTSRVIKANVALRNSQWISKDES